MRRFFDKIAVVADRVNEQFEGDKIELDLIVDFFQMCRHKICVFTRKAR